jgi:hypothetical protein
MTLIDELIKVDPLWFRDFVLGGPGGLKGWFSTLALIAISWSFKTVVSVLTKSNILIERAEENLEDATDAIIENSKLVRENNKINENLNNNVEKILQCLK